MKQLRAQLKQLKDDARVCPSSDWIAQNKAQMLQQIETVAPSTVAVSWHERLGQVLNVFVPQQVQGMARISFMLILVISIASGGWGLTVSATPGDLTYAIKSAVEEIQIKTAGSEQRKAQLNYTFAKRRADEAKKLLEKGQDDFEKHAPKAIESLKKNIEAAKVSVVELSEDENESEKVLEVLNVGTEITEDIETTLEQMADEVDAVKTIDVNLSKDLAATKKAVSDTNIDTITIVVNKKEQGQLAVDDEQIKQIVQAQIDKLTKDAEETQERVKEVKTLSETAKMAEATDTEVQETSTTAVAEETEGGDGENVEEILKKAEERSGAAKQAADEAKVLADGGKLGEALVKAKEASASVNEGSEATTAVEKIVREAQEEKEVATSTDSTVTTTVGIVTTTKATSTVQTEEGSGGVVSSTPSTEGLEEVKEGTTEQ